MTETTETTAQNPPARGRKTIPLIALVLFVLAAGTFGTLWVLERGEHSEVSEQLTVVRTESDGVRTKLGEAEKKQADLDKQVTEAAHARRIAENTADTNRICSDATKEMRNAAIAGNETEYNSKFDIAYYSCGGTD